MSGARAVSVGCQCGVDLDHLGVSQLSTIKLPSSSLSVLCHLEGSHYSQPKLKKWGIMLASMRSGDSLMAQPRKNLPAVQETEEM